MNQFPLLSVITLLPLVGGLILLALPGARLQKWWALGVSLATFVISCLLFVWWKAGEAGMQFVERLPWVPQFNIQYYLGVDGLSLFLVLLTTFLTVLVILFSWEGVEQQLKPFLALLLLLETGMIGVFVALDLVLFYAFWELSLIPMYFLIGGWGDAHGTYNFLGRTLSWRVYAALKFFLYTFAGSALMLVAILVLYIRGGTFDLLALQQIGLAPNLQFWLFLAFGLAFAIKVPLFPFHTWLPDAHVEAPTAGSVILASVLLKMGTYGFVRFCLPLFPDASRQLGPWIAALAIVGILYGALVALVQKDVKSLVAYSSVAHLGFVMLGIFALNAQGVAGATLQMVNHGLSTGALFLMVGMLYNRRHTRLLADFGGLWKQIPIYGFLFLIVALSSAGLPGLNGFVGEFNILLGAFQMNRAYAVFGTLGIILAAWYLLVAVRQMLHGPLNKAENMAVRDLNVREIVTLAPIILLFFVIGLFPNLFFDKINPSAQAVVDALNRPQPIVSMAVDSER
ncbi:MAG: NADH-quinone oxidoreductase subunit M [Chloroflexi bacterium ADurb.Bin325]|nr:MAG: NADH-quinone oxidoreductase subunit M [Chloroflexi bacterium ADurb.Bin325]